MRALVGITDADFRRNLTRHADLRSREGDAETRLELLGSQTLEAARAVARTAKPAIALLDAAMLEDAALRDALGDAMLIAVAPRTAVRELPRACVAILGATATPEEAAFALERAASRAIAEERAARAEARLGAELGELVTASKSMRELVRKAKRCATNGERALVIGEPGTGKELLANVAKGGAKAHRIDLARAVDEAKELEAIDRGEDLLVLHVERLSRAGQERLLEALLARRAPRVVATADASIHGMVAERAFDKALFIALAHVVLDVPPLRSRPDDVAVLAHHLLGLERARRGLGPAKLAAGAMRALRAHDYRLNVTELQAVIAHAAVVMRGATLVEGDLPFERAGGPPKPFADEPYAAARAKAIAAFEDAYVRDAMTRTSENIAQAADLAGMDRANFRRLLRRTRAR
ncbi:MAG: sigma 54-interacting transcriptional regulator [Polyangiaceae bacterium]